MKKKIITVKVDESCEVAAVYVGRECIMLGNYWDFHPGCHGIWEYGDFRTYSGLVMAIENKLLKEGFSVETKYNRNWKYIP